MAAGGESGASHTFCSRSTLALMCFALLGWAGLAGSVFGGYLWLGGAGVCCGVWLSPGSLCQLPSLTPSRAAQQHGSDSTPGWSLRAGARLLLFLSGTAPKCRNGLELCSSSPFCSRSSAQGQPRHHRAPRRAQPELPPAFGCVCGCAVPPSLQPLAGGVCPVGTGRCHPRAGCSFGSAELSSHGSRGSRCPT